MSRITRPKVSSPAVAYQADTRSRAKLFPNGRSQAVRLPVEFRLPGTEVYIHREGDRVILEPITEQVDAKGWPIGFWARLDALGEDQDFPDVEPLPAHLLTPAELGSFDKEPR